MVVILAAPGRVAQAGVQAAPLVSEGQGPVRAGQVVEEDPAGDGQADSAQPRVLDIVPLKEEIDLSLYQDLEPHLAGIDGQLYELPARAPQVGIGLQGVSLSCVIRNLIIRQFPSEYMYICTTYIVGDEDPLAVVNELSKVGGGGVSAVSIAEGNLIAGPKVDISLNTSDDLVF